MDKEVEEDYTVNHPGSFMPLDYSLDQQHHRQQQQNLQILRRQEMISSDNQAEMVDYMLGGNPAAPPPAHRQISLDKLSFANVMQFADFGPKLALNQAQSKSSDDDSDLIPRFLEPLVVSSPVSQPPPAFQIEEGLLGQNNHEKGDQEEEARFSENASSVHQLGFLGEAHQMGGIEVKINRRKRPRSMKTSEEVESQRMTHIAVERNRRKQMNEHLRVLRSLMPSSYVHRGDQASIIGGAIEFVRELEQLLQCLESQKRRRIFSGGEGPRMMTADAPPLAIGGQQQQQQAQQPFFPAISIPSGADHMKQLVDYESHGLREDMAENKSCLADIEVRLLGFDAMIKILSRRRPGQLLKTIAALEDLQLNILHTNITTIEQTVLYSFNVKITSDTRCSAEDIANSVQQILSFIEASTF